MNNFVVSSTEFSFLLQKRKVTIQRVQFETKNLDIFVKHLTVSVKTKNKQTKIYKMVLIYCSLLCKRYTVSYIRIYVHRNRNIYLHLSQIQLPNVPFKILPSIQKRYTQSVQINNTSKPNFRFCPVSSITPQQPPICYTRENIIIKATLKKLRFHLRFFNSSNTKTISFYTCHQICIYI